MTAKTKSKNERRLPLRERWCREPPAGRNPLADETGEWTYFPQVADGYWLMLEPRARGSHEIVVSVRGETPYFGLVEFQIIHNITVTRSGSGAGNDHDDEDCD